MKKQWKGPELRSNDLILQHDNAPAYEVLSIKKFLAQNLIIEMEYPSYSPDFVLNDFCFQK